MKHQVLQRHRLLVFCGVIGTTGKANELKPILKKRQNLVGGVMLTLSWPVLLYCRWKPHSAFCFQHYTQESD